jgi:hypothetical protein
MAASANARISVPLFSRLHFLTLLDYKEFKSSQQRRNGILELSPVDLNRFRTLQKGDKQLQAVFELSKSETLTMTVKIGVISSSKNVQIRPPLL